MVNARQPGSFDIEVSQSQEIWAGYAMRSAVLKLRFRTHPQTI